MRLLLDTHVVLWAVLDAPELPPAFRAALTDRTVETYVSAVSVWEVSIKRALGKLDVPADLFDRVRGAGGRPLPVTWEHAARVEDLPRHHADPFDRMLIAQAQCEGLTLLTTDRQIALYDVAQMPV